MEQSVAKSKLEATADTESLSFFLSHTHKWENLGSDFTYAHRSRTRWTPHEILLTPQSFPLGKTSFETHLNCPTCQKSIAIRVTQQTYFLVRPSDFSKVGGSAVKWAIFWNIWLRYMSGMALFTGPLFLLFLFIVINSKWRPKDILFVMSPWLAFVCANSVYSYLRLTFQPLLLECREGWIRKKRSPLWFSPKGGKPVNLIIGLTIVNEDTSGYSSGVACHVHNIGITSHATGSLQIIPPDAKKVHAIRKGKYIPGMDA